MTTTAADEAPATVEAAPLNASTAGAALRRAREARGLHIAALAAMLKVPQSKLEAIEADRYDLLPDATFVRALARSMCRVLKLEAEPVLALLPRGGNEASLDRVTPGLNQPFRERAASQEPMISAALLKSPKLLGVAALLIAALAVYLVPGHVVEDLMHRVKPEPEATSTQTVGGAGTSTEPTSIEAPTVSASDAVAIDSKPVAQAPASAPTVTEPVATQAIPPAVAPTPTPTPTPAPTVATTAPATTPTASASTPAVVPPGSAPLRVRASADTWVEVIDAKGQVLLSRLLRGGEQADVNGVAPLKLRVGNVSGTELVFRGQPVDLASRSRDNVARLELN